jgi:hypothetical protein
MRQPEPNNNAVMDLSGANKRHDDDRPLVMQPSDTNESVSINKRFPNALGDDKHHFIDVRIARTSNELMCSTRFQGEDIIVDHLLRLSHVKQRSVGIGGLSDTLHRYRRRGGTRRKSRRYEIINIG